MSRAPLIVVWAFVAALASPLAAAPLYRALIVDGQNNHNWQATTPLLGRALEESGLFAVDVATSPPKGGDMSKFQPNFAAYQVVVSNYNGDDWSGPTQQALEQYMKAGGGLVVVHAADNAFPKWRAWNEMIGLGGWGGRDERSGPYVRFGDDGMVLNTEKGRGGSHGEQHPFQIVIRNPDHPITAGLPRVWMHAKDELYDRLRGPAYNIDVLGTAFSSEEKRGSGENEPVLFTIRYGKGRTFHTTLGHSPESMHCVGFIVTLVRGAEWAASGRVTKTEVPADFPTADKVSLRP